MKYGKVLISLRRFHDAYPSYRSSHLCQFAGHCEDQIGLSDGKDCRYEEWKTKSDTPFRACDQCQSRRSFSLTAAGQPWI
jgi:hypothetical protein